MNAILHLNGVRVQGSTDKNFLMCSTPEGSFGISRERVAALRELLGVMLTVTDPRTFEELIDGPDNIVPIMARPQAGG